MLKKLLRNLILYRVVTNMLLVISSRRHKNSVHELVSKAKCEQCITLARYYTSNSDTIQELTELLDHAQIDSVAEDIEIDRLEL